jgi:L-lactate dehydrogenase complex protein LldE
MAQQKVENALATGAEYIVSTDSLLPDAPAGIIDHHNLPIRTMHIIDVLAQGA